MKLLLIPITLLLLCQCSLVTVPVKTAGAVVETTVKTAGSVVEAPFKAVGGHHEKRETESRQSENSSPQRAQPVE